MTVRSMTGYAVTTHETALGTLTIELRSVNSRFLDLQFRMNDDLRAVEPALREALMKQATRGKIECRLSLGKSASSTAAQALNASLLADLARCQKDIQATFPNASPLTVNELLRWPGVLEDAGISQETLQAEVISAMSTTVTAFAESRAREGAGLVSMLIERVDAMIAIVKRITPIVPQVVAQFQQKSVERLQEALGLADKEGAMAVQVISREEILERIRQEVTLYGIRIDVAEELSRMSIHLEETRQILKKGGPVGKRLDFMLQELNREANTLGSKSTVKELSDASMELKLLIEQMREQVQNLE